MVSVETWLDALRERVDTEPAVVAGELRWALATGAPERRRVIAELLAQQAKSIPPSRGVSTLRGQVSRARAEAGDMALRQRIAELEADIRACRSRLALVHSKLAVVSADQEGG